MKNLLETEYRPSELCGHVAIDV